jgi:hypothetical protein
MQIRQFTEGEKCELAPLPTLVPHRCPHTFEPLGAQ